MAKYKDEIEQYYNQFIEYLKNESSKIAYLQLCGKIEEYLVKEFMFCIFKDSQGQRLIIQNVGEKEEQKIDLVVLNGDIYTKQGKGLFIETAIEAKYICNCNRFYTEFSTIDDISTSLKQLVNQTNMLINRTHGDYKLKSKTLEIYGLVFASFISEKKKSDKKVDFFNKILESKHSECYQNYDSSRIDFTKVHDDVMIEVLGKKFFVTLRMALWKKK